MADGPVVDGRTVREVGEFGLIAELQAALPPAAAAAPPLALGIGDDAAVWDPTPGERVVVTTDGLVEAIHFRLDWTDWERLGHKALAVNVSDIAAMGGRPRLAVVTLALRGDERLADLRAFYRGMGALAARTGVVVAGGDIVRSPAALAVTVTLLGETIDGGRVLTRSGARPGDVIGVSGTLGAAAAGLRLLGEPGLGGRQAATADLLLEAHRRPEPRVALGQALLLHGATAAMDLSDGLFGDLPKILVASRVTAAVDAAAIPVTAAVRALFPGDWLELATQGGEDYELLFTAPPAAWAGIATAAAAAGSTVTAVGEVLEAGGRPQLVLREPGGNARPVSPGAFDHFRSGA